MNTDRLETLANRLIKVAGELDRGRIKGRKFSLNYWYKTQDCGAVCCAIGEAAAIKSFRDEGFHLAGDPIGIGMFPAYQTETGWPAVLRFFDIDAKDARYLFDVSGYAWQASPRDVAQRIRLYVKERESCAA